MNTTVYELFDFFKYAKLLSRSTSEYTMLRQKLLSARSALSVLDRIAACARALRRIKHLVKSHDLVEVASFTFNHAHIREHITFILCIFPAL